MNIRDLACGLFDAGIPSIVEGDCKTEKKQILRPAVSKNCVMCQVLFVDMNGDVEKVVLCGNDGKTFCEEVVLKAQIAEFNSDYKSGRGSLPPNFPRPTEEELDEFRKYIAANTWKTSTTMAKFSPHQYILNFPCWKMKEDGKCSGFCDSCKKSRAEFEKWVLFIRKYGERQKMLKTVYTVLCVDDRQYWTMGDPMNTTWVLNRALIDDPNRVPRLYWLDRM